MRLSPIFFSVLLVVAFGAGCGSSSGSSSELPGASSVRTAADPCALVTKEEAAIVLGEEVATGIVTDQGEPLGQRLCSYPSVSKTKAVGMQISIVQDRGMSGSLRESGYSVAQMYEDGRKESQQRLSVSGAVQETGERAFKGDVTGVGEKAYWDSTTGLNILQGDSLMTISVSLRGDKKTMESMAKEKAIELGKKVLTKLTP